MRRLRLSVGCLLGAVVLCAGAAQGERYVVQTPYEKTFDLPGGYAAFADPVTGALYEFDFGFGETAFATQAIFDTGASGMLVSASVVGTLGLPTTGETFEDIGIGGVETFDVTGAVEVRLAYHDDDLETVPVQGDFVSVVPSAKLQARQADPLLTGPVDVIGMPALIGNVMEVNPHFIGELTLYPFVSYAQTYLHDTEPAEMPYYGLRMPLVQQNFINDPNPPVTVSTNPMVPGVRARFESGDALYASEWLYDTGASVTIIGRDLAGSIGINLATDAPVTTVTVIGVGETTRDLFGYRVDELVLPLDGGDELVYEDVVVFVPEAGALPADLPGILGSNLWNTSYDGDDLFTAVPQSSSFERYYVDLINDEVVFVLPGDPSIAGDVNMDGAVDGVDLYVVSANYGSSGHDWFGGDFDGDGDVDDDDVAYVHANWGVDLETSLKGDANLDGVVDGLDLYWVARNWEQGVLGWRSGDFNDDLVVDALDVELMRDNWVGAPGALDAVPEPGGLGLLVLGVAGVLRRRGRNR